MGNTQSPPSKSKLSQFIKTKFHKTEKNDSDNFIIKHYQNNKEIDASINIESFDQRRVVFVSLLGIYQSWQRVPSIVLYSSILLMPLKRKWIYNPSKHKQELQSHFISKFNAYYDVTARNELIELLKWKDNQNLVVWMLDDYSNNNNNGKDSLIDPFWCYLSNFVANLYDPISGTKYNKLNLNEEWWQNEKHFVSKYNTTAANIMSELYFLSMKYNTIQEILYQSNANLHPIKTYNNIANRISATVSIPETGMEYIISPDDMYIDDEEKDNYFFSSDYNAYCMDTNDIENKMIQCINSNCDTF
eukprot:160669_1